MPNHLKSLFFLTLMSAAIAAEPSMAHTGGGHAGGFLSGFTHPVLGWDHVVAMLAVGVWGAFLGSRAIWILPVVFPLVMALGAVVGILGLPVPATEAGIAMSAVILGLMIVFTVRPPVAVAGLIVGAFAVFHGYAHGTELPATANAFTFGLGFIAATAMLHLIGIAFGLLARFPGGHMAVRGAGGVISLAGAGFLTGIV